MADQQDEQQEFRIDHLPVSVSESFNFSGSKSNLMC